MTFTISPAIKQCWPETALGLLLYQVQVAPSSPQLLAQFDQTVASLAQQYTLDTIAKHPHIAATRQAYKALGASPHEHRNAAEAMLRRVVKQAGLYHINNVVEVNNLLSSPPATPSAPMTWTSSRARWSWPVPRRGPGTRALARGVSPSPTCPCSPTTWAPSATPAATAAGR